MLGSLDQWMMSEEIKEILHNLCCLKELVVFSNTGYTTLVTVDRQL
jgi:hypothetical protein